MTKLLITLLTILPICLYSADRGSIAFLLNEDNDNTVIQPFTWQTQQEESDTQMAEMPAVHKAHRIKKNPEMQARIRDLIEEGKGLTAISEALQHEFGQEGTSRRVLNAWLKEQNIAPHGWQWKEQDGKRHLVKIRNPQQITSPVHAARKIKANSDMQACIRDLIAEGNSLTAISEALQHEFGQEGTSRKALTAWLEKQNIAPRGWQWKEQGGKRHLIKIRNPQQITSSAHTTRISSHIHKARRIKGNPEIQARIRYLIAEGKNTTAISEALQHEFEECGNSRRVLTAWLKEQNIAPRGWSWKKQGGRRCLVRTK